MRTIDDYCDQARHRNNLPSDVQLSKALGINSSAISQWRTKRTWPSEHTMVKIAELAEINPDEALIELGAWRTAGTPVYHRYERMLRTIKRIAPAMILAVTALSPSLYNQTKAEQLFVQVPTNKHYGKHAASAYGWLKLQQE